MPVSKRDKKVSLTKTSKKGMALKQHLVEDIRMFLNKYDNLFVFTMRNMRNGPLKDLREEWKDSRFFFAKRKVMAIALGRTEAEEVQKNIHKVASHLVGQCGLLFTNRPKDQVVEWFKDFSKMEFAKSGFLATETVTLPAGPLSDFSFSLEPHLRSLGLPTQLEKGKIILREDYTVCTQGVKITPEQASILKLFGKQMAEFKIKIVCVWSKDGSFERFKVPKAKQLKSENNTELQEKIKKRKSKSLEPVNKTAEEITQLFDQQTINKVEILRKKDDKKSLEMEVINSGKKLSKKTAQEEPNTVKEESGVLQESTVAKLSKSNSKNSPKAKAEEKTQTLHEVSEKVTLNEQSPQVMKGTPRRSMRTPKPIRRTPEEKKQSLKKLTESNKKTKSALKDTAATKPARGTPRKSVGKKIFNEPEDVEMAE